MKEDDKTLNAPEEDSATSVTGDSEAPASPWEDDAPVSEVPSADSPGVSGEGSVVVSAGDAFTEAASESASAADSAPEASAVDPAFTPRDLQPLEDAAAAEDVKPPKRSWFERFRRKPKDVALESAGESPESAPMVSADDMQVAAADSVVTPAEPSTPPVEVTDASGLTGVLDVLRERSVVMRGAEPDDEAAVAESATEHEGPAVAEEPIATPAEGPLLAEVPSGPEVQPPAPESIFAWLAEPEDEDLPSDGTLTSDEPLFPGSLAQPTPVAGVVAGPGDAAPVDLAGTLPTTALPPVTATPLEVDLGPERKKKWWIWVVVAVAVLLVGGGIGYGWWWMTQRPIVVPDIVGKKPADATQKLNDLGLKLGKASEVPTDAAPAGTIIAQKPKSNTTLKPGSAVAFIVAAAPEQAKTPNVVGISADAAAAALAEARLRPMLVESYNATVAAGFVISQIPSMGVEVPPGSQVALAVSQGLAPSSATVPHTLGLPEADGTTLLEARGLTVRVFRSRDASVSAGQIVAQTPLPGSASAPGSVAMILVSTGNTAGSTNVPEVVGRSRKTAESELKSRGLTSEIVSVPNATVAKGNVIAQMPPSKRKVGSGAVVGLLVSKGPDQPVGVPSIVGTLSADASKTVTAKGFKAVSLSLPFAGVAEGRVWAQYPLPGTSYTRGYPVIFLIAEPLK